MKAFITSLLLCLALTPSHAQTEEEMFSQKSTQRKYLFKQIALLQLYLGYLKKGYTIADRGLTTVHNIKNGDFNLHRDFFGSLKNVNPVLTNSVKAADCLAFQIFIVQNMKRINDFCRKDRNFSAEEIRYVARVYRNMLVLTDASLAELRTIVDSGQSVMKDDERLKRIDKVYDDILQEHAFVKSFESDVRELAHERERERRNIAWTNKQYQLL